MNFIYSFIFLCYGADFSALLSTVEFSQAIQPSVHYSCPVTKFYEPILPRNFRERKIFFHFQDFQSVHTHVDVFRCRIFFYKNLSKVKNECL